MVTRRTQGSALKTQPDLLLLPSGVSGAFAVGARNPRILISNDLIEHFDEHELEAILAHEIAHLEARDVPIIFTAGILRDAVGWNPISHVAFRRLITDRELEADRRAATLTGRPLAVASGLLKMCDLMGRHTRFGNRLAVGFLRPGGRIATRISHLIALADGNSVAATDGRLPYLMAGLLVAVLGLQVGARITHEDASAFAIVWGAPQASVSELFQPPPKGTIFQGTSTKSPAHRKLNQRAQRVYRQLTHDVSLRREDLGIWFDTMVQFRYSQTGQAAKLDRDALQIGSRWQAVPLSAPVAGMGLYRIDAANL